MRKEFKSIIEDLPVITKLIDWDYAIGITSTNEYIYSVEGKDLRITIISIYRKIFILFKTDKNLSVFFSI